MIDKTNFLKGSLDSTEEKKALDEISEYLVSKGKYGSIRSSKKDAIDRIRFFESLGFYRKDPSLKNASIERKSVHALIYGHDLHNLLIENDGFLPVTKPENGIDKSKEDPIEKLFNIVDEEIKSGKSRIETINKLTKCNMEPGRAAELYEVVLNTHKNKVKARKIAITILAAMLIVTFLFVW